MRSFSMLRLVNLSFWAAASSTTGAKAAAPAEAASCSAAEGTECPFDSADEVAHMQVHQWKPHTPIQTLQTVQLDRCTGGGCPETSDHYYPADPVDNGNISKRQVSARAGQSLQDCLKGGHGLSVNLDVRFPGDAGFDNDKKCVNRRPDILPEPLALVDVKAEGHVRAAVVCAKRAGVQVCAKTGQHGFDNDAGCSHGIQLFMQGLQGYRVQRNINGVPYTVTFGAGHTLGQLYYKLWTYENPGLMIPGGVVAGVGTTGLILGCGRGYFSQSHGLACDSILSVKFVNADGEFRNANVDKNPDMFWMAKGSGGEFPGIVVELTMQAYVAPTNIYEMKCHAGSGEMGRLVKEWLSQGQALSDNTKYFTHVTLWNEPKQVHLAMACMDCSNSEKNTMSNTFWGIWNGQGTGCSSTTRDWMGQLLFESGVQDGAVEPPVPSALLDHWQGYGKRPNVGSAKAGSRMVYDWWDWNTSPGSDLDTVIGNLDKYTYWETVPGAYALFVGLYFTGGSKINNIATSATAYGPRKAKWVIHYKHGWSADTHNSQMMNHHHNMAASFDGVLPCEGFYNYKDPDLTCAGNSVNTWLKGYFSDVRRMRSIKGHYDSDNVFRNRLTGIAAPTPAPQPTLPPAPTNLALNQPCYAFSQESSQFPPSNAVDGNSGTRWSSSFNKPKSQWIIVYLAGLSEISRVDVHWEAACARKYKLWGTVNATHWFALSQRLDGVPNGVVSTPMSAGTLVTQVYLECFSRCTQNGYSIREFEVWGVPSTALAQVPAPPVPAKLPQLDSGLVHK